MMRACAGRAAALTARDPLLFPSRPQGKGCRAPTPDDARTETKRQSRSLLRDIRSRFCLPLRGRAYFAAVADRQPGSNILIRNI